MPSPNVAAHCRAYHNANQSINDATWTSVALNSERSDTIGLHDTVTNNSRITIPTDWDGLWTVGGSGAFASNTTGVRAIRILLNGTTQLFLAGLDAVGGGNRTPLWTPPVQYRFAVGDYVEMQVIQTSGGALNLDAVGNYAPEFYAKWERA